VDPNDRRYTGLDFMHEEAREERFSLIEEVLNNYPVDGFELHLNYVPCYFHPGDVERGTEVMTAWVRRVHDAVKQSGADRELAVRVPASVEGCLSIGLDPAGWAREGIVDVLIGNTYQGPELCDQMTDYGPLVEAAKGTGTRVHATIQSIIDSDRVHHGPISAIRAAATNYWAQGVDGLYVAYWHGLWPYDARVYEKLREIPHPDVMAPKDKLYFVPTAMGRFPEPEPEPGITMQLPRELVQGAPESVEFMISDDLSRWDTMGRVHEVVLRCRVVNSTERDAYRVSLNGAELPDSLRRTVNSFYGKAPRYRVQGYWYVFHLDREHWPVQGRNVFEAVLEGRDPDVTPAPALRDVEVEVRYLMGRNYYRLGGDPDLGPQEG